MSSDRVSPNKRQNVGQIHNFQDKHWRGVNRSNDPKNISSGFVRRIAGTNVRKSWI